jgi:hypothetical protein
MSTVFKGNFLSPFGFFFQLVAPFLLSAISPYVHVRVSSTIVRLIFGHFDIVLVGLDKCTVVLLASNCRKSLRCLVIPGFFCSLVIKVLKYIPPLESLSVVGRLISLLGLDVVQDVCAFIRCWLVHLPGLHGVYLFIEFPL